MKKYNEPKIEIKKFEKENILTVSGKGAAIDGGSAGFKVSWFITAIDGGSTSFRDSWSTKAETVLEYK